MSTKADVLFRASIAQWKNDIVAFIEHCLIDPETGKYFVLYPEQRIYLKHAFERTPDGHMRYTELVFSAGKKSGKSTLAALIIIFVAVALAGVGGEINLASNDFEQSKDRIFKMVSLILQASPLLKHSVEITASKITFRATGTVITALANEYRSFSGSNPSLNCYDELAYYNSESSCRMFEEGIPSPSRKISFRLSVSTAGFENEPSPLKDLYDRAIQHGDEIAPELYRHENMLCYWTHAMRAPWQRPEWIADQKRTLRPSQYLRLIENRWTSSESTFISAEMYDRCVNPEARPCLIDQRLTVFAGLDASLRHDTTALVAVTYDFEQKRVRVVAHRLFRPRGSDIDFAEVENAVVDFQKRFALISVSYDPFQLESTAQRLRTRGVPMEALNQTTGNLTEAADRLLELFKQSNITLYPDDDVREAVLNASVKEVPSGRGFRLAKEKPSKKIDLCAALSFACLTAIREYGGSAVLTESDRQYMASANAALHARSRSPGGLPMRRGVDGLPEYDYHHRDECIERDRAEDGAGSVRTFGVPSGRGRLFRRGAW